jgi:hypothetical protein
MTAWGEGIRTIKFGRVQTSVLVMSSVVNSPKWVSCDGIDLAIGSVFANLGSAERPNVRWDRAAPKFVSMS